MSLILIVDDIPAFCEQYAYDLKRLGGYETVTATSGEQALAALRDQPVDGLILDLEMPGMDGFALLKRLRQEQIRLPVIVYTGTGNYERCVRAIKLGAYSFIDKAEPMERVVREIENALSAHQLAEENRSLKKRLGGERTLLGESPPMDALRRQIARLAPLPAPVLIVGESGTGKELVARELHRQSPRAAHKFLPVNCAALPEDLIESQLFGHEAGAFTGATRVVRGAFETVSEGTLFLDEIGELPAAAQAKLLRVLEEKKVLRVGATQQLPVDTRVLAATHRDLARDVQAGRFREDLLYRVNMHVIRVPPLRERPADIPLLAGHFLAQICEEYGRRPKRFDERALGRLRGYDWARNNVRELRNAVARMVIHCEGELVTCEHLPPEITAAVIANGSTAAHPVAAHSVAAHSVAVDSVAADSVAADSVANDSAVEGAGTLRDQKMSAERAIVLAALVRHDWQITRTAKALGLADHSSLLKIMRRHGIRRS